jgi:hypothetical protein
VTAAGGEISVALLGRIEAGGDGRAGAFVAGDVAGLTGAAADPVAADAIDAGARRALVVAAAEGAVGQRGGGEVGREIRLCVGREVVAVAGVAGRDIEIPGRVRLGAGLTGAGEIGGRIAIDEARGLGATRVVGAGGFDRGVVRSAGRGRGQIDTSEQQQHGPQHKRIPREHPPIL